MPIYSLTVYTLILVSYIKAELRTCIEQQSSHLAQSDIIPQVDRNDNLLLLNSLLKRWGFFQLVIRKFSFALIIEGCCIDAYTHNGKRKLNGRTEIVARTVGGFEQIIVQRHTTDVQTAFNTELNLCLNRYGKTKHQHCNQCKYCCDFFHISLSFRFLTPPRNGKSLCKTLIWNATKIRRKSLTHWKLQ